MKAATKPVEIPALKAELDHESYEWLEINRPAFLEALGKDMANGVAPEQVYSKVMAYTGREELAQRLRQAARHMQRAIG